MLGLSGLMTIPVQAYEPQLGDQFEYSIAEYHEFYLDIVLSHYNITTGQLVHVTHEMRLMLDQIFGRDQFKVLDLYRDPGMGPNMALLDHAGIFNGTHQENVTRDEYNPFTGQWDNSSYDDMYFSDSFGDQFRFNESVPYNATHFPLGIPGIHLGQGRDDLMRFPFMGFLGQINTTIYYLWSESSYLNTFYLNNGAFNLTVLEFFAQATLTFPELELYIMGPPPPPNNETISSPPLKGAQDEPMPPPPDMNLTVIGYNVTLYVDHYFGYDNSTGFLLYYGNYYGIYSENLWINGTIQVMSPPSGPGGNSSLNSAQQDYIEVYVEGNGTFWISGGFDVLLVKHSTLYGGYDFTNDDLFSIISPSEPHPTPGEQQNETDTTSATNVTTDLGNETNQTAAPPPSLVTPGYELIPFVAAINILGAIYILRKRRR